MESICLLAHVVSTCLIVSWEYVRPQAFMQGSKKLKEDSNWKEVSLLIKEKVLDMLQIKNMDIYTYIATSFEENLNKLLTTSVFKGSVINKANKKMVDFLAPEIIQHNYQKLDSIYRKGLNYNDLDERIFYKERTNTITPNRMTPFAKQGYVNRLNQGTQKGTSGQTNLASHRVLTYDNFDMQESALPQKESGNSNFSKIGIPKSVKQTPNGLKTPLIVCKTPIANGMEMFNYIS